MNKNYPLYICIMFFILLNISLLFTNINSKNKENNYFRLHIVANSNSIEDQITKLNVSKKINTFLNELYSSNQSTIYGTDKNSVKKIIENNIDNILEVANNELKNQNANYSCYANIGKIKYDEKKSDIINMDKGIYDSIKLVLGNGNGENYWSLIFPYSYNPNFNIENNSDKIIEENIEVKSGLLEIIEKVVKSIKT